MKTRKTIINFASLCCMLVIAACLGSYGEPEKVDSGITPNEYLAKFKPAYINNAGDHCLSKQLLVGALLGPRNKSECVSITEYVPDGQTVENWSEILTTQFIEAEYGTLQYLYEQKMEITEKKCGHAVPHSVIEQSPKKMIFEWASSGCNKSQYRGDDEYYIMAFYKGKGGTHVVFYAKKGATISAELRNYIIDKLRSTVIRKGNQVL